MANKTCTKCTTSKPLSEFYKIKRRGRMELKYAEMFLGG